VKVAIRLFLDCDLFQRGGDDFSGQKEIFPP